MKRTHAQSGSVFFLILVGIALFAALSYAMIQGGRSSASNLSKDQARLAANELVSYATSLQKAVDKLRLSGCKDTELNFHHPLDVGNQLVNPTSPSDKSCDLFSVNGGNLTVSSMPPNTLDKTYESQTALGYGVLVPTGDVANDTVGTTANELAGVAPFINKQVCMAINQIAGIANPGDSPPITTASWNYTPFTGTYNSSSGGVSGNNNTAKGKSFGCIETSSWSPGMYFFFVNLVAR